MGDDIQLVNEDGVIVGRDPETGERVPIDFEAIGAGEVRIADTGTRPTEAGELRRDGADVVVRTGGETRALGAAGAGADDRATTVVSPGASIQAAVDDLPDEGGTVVLEAGEFEEAGIDLNRGGVRLVGQGRATTIKIPDDAPDTAFGVFWTEPVHNELANFAIDGNKSRSETAVTSGADMVEIEHEGATGVVEHLFVHDSLGEAIDIDACEWVIVDGCETEDNAGNGLHSSDSDNGIVTWNDCHSRNDQQERTGDRAGGMVIRGENVVVDGCTVEGAPTALACDDSGVDDPVVSFTGCRFKSPGQPIQLFGGVEATFAECRIERTDGGPVWNPAGDLDGDAIVRFDGGRIETAGGADTAAVVRLEDDATYLFTDGLHVPGDGTDALLLRDGLAIVSDCVLGGADSNERAVRTAHDGRARVRSSECLGTVRFETDDNWAVANTLHGGIEFDGTAERDQVWVEGNLDRQA